MNALPVDRIRVLISYHYYKRVDLDERADDLVVAGNPPDLFADSGAFSAWTQNAVIHVDDYATWLHRWGHRISVYVNLDVIDDPAGTEQNQRALESNGLAPLPVWHVRSPRQVFQRLCDEYRYVAIGGMVGTRWNRLMPTLVWAFRTASETDTVIHGLGLTSPGPLSRLPFFSVDSSSWGSGFRYGRVPVWDIRRDRMVRIKIADSPGWFRHGPAVKRLGFSPARFANREADRREIAAIAALSTAFQEQQIRRQLGTVYLPPGDRPACRFDDDDGCKLFLAERDLENLVQGARGLRIYMAEGGADDATPVVQYWNEQIGAANG